MLSGPGSYTEVLTGLNNPEQDGFGEIYALIWFVGYYGKDKKPIFRSSTIDYKQRHNYMYADN